MGGIPYNPKFKIGDKIVINTSRKGLTGFNSLITYVEEIWGNPKTKQIKHYKLKGIGPEFYESELSLYSSKR